VYDDTRSQYFLTGSKNKTSQNSAGTYFNWGSMCQNAVNYVSNKVVWKLASNEPFYTGTTHIIGIRKERAILR